MSFLTGLIGTGAGAVAIAAAVLLMTHHRRLPLKQAHPWIARLGLIIAYAAGAALAATVLGSWADTAITWTAGLFGGFAAGLPFAAVTIALMVLIIGQGLGLAFDPYGASVPVMAMLPVLMAIPQSGIIHTIYQAVDAPAIALASGLAHMIGG